MRKSRTNLAASSERGDPASRRQHVTAAAVVLLVAAVRGSAAPAVGQRPEVAATAAVPAVTSGAGPRVAAGHGWTADGVEGPVPGPGTCRLRQAAVGGPLPDPACTPGSLDPAVTAATLSTTVCREGGYAASVRPPLAVTAAVKRRLLAAYGIPLRDVATYEADHLVAISTGGSSSTLNLWPEPDTVMTATPSRYVHNDKDAVEGWTFDALCAGTIQLGALQHAMAGNWSTAVAALGLPPVPAGYGSP